MNWGRAPTMLKTFMRTPNLLEPRLARARLHSASQTLVLGTWAAIAPLPRPFRYKGSASGLLTIGSCAPPGDGVVSDSKPLSVYHATAISLEHCLDIPAA